MVRMLYLPNMLSRDWWQRPLVVNERVVFHLVDDPFLQAWLAIRLSFFMNAVLIRGLSGLANTEVETSGSRQEYM